jgi:hypothetical protein
MQVVDLGLERSHVVPQLGHLGQQLRLWRPSAGRDATEEREEHEEDRDT